jgi:DNA-binding NtrC family response regulator
VSIGVADDNSLIVRDARVSRYHLELTATADGVRVRDLGSLNGTFTSGVRVFDALLPPGARIELGDTVLELEDAGVAPEKIDELEQGAPVPGMVAQSVAMREIGRLIQRLAPTHVSVLIQGETGTGKEVVARAIHALSPRHEGPFEVVDGGALPPTLIASELFGHERGAFTGADRQREGAFERADGGTLFLDEIGELLIEIQAVLLGVVERRKFRRVGGTKELACDVRIVCATHRDLRTAVNDGSFRADVYYRLAVSRIVIPPLRDRPDDIPPLVRMFVEELTGDPQAMPFGHGAIESLMMHRWSGNVRELRNVVENALAMGELGLADEPGASRSEPTSYRDARAAAIHRFEHTFLKSLIESCEGNASAAARRAKMDRPHLLTLLRKHGLR